MDIFEKLSDEQLVEQVFGNPIDSGGYQKAIFELEQRRARRLDAIAERQERFNLVVTIATVVMAVQAVATIVALFTSES
jgi:predicted lysophospholipase L1 biosynthesis ABC-type transport system permease subunit